ncbi:MAG: hypothetical protein R3Y50_01615 [Rikenellaceae bacterium]
MCCNFHHHHCDVHGLSCRYQNVGNGIACNAHYRDYCECASEMCEYLLHTSRSNVCYIHILQALTSEHAPTFGAIGYERAYEPLTTSKLLSKIA